MKNIEKIKLIAFNILKYQKILFLLTLINI